MDDEFSQIDPELRKILDELVNHSLACISSLAMSEQVIIHPWTTDADKMHAIKMQSEAFQTLDDIAHCFQLSLKL